MTASWSTSSSQPGREPRPGRTLGYIRARATVVMISRFPSAPKRGRTTVFRGADDDRVIAAAKKGAPTSLCAQDSLDKLASFSLKKYGSEKAHRLALEWTRIAQWMYDTFVTQDDETLEYSDVHFASHRHAADWEAFLCTLPARDSVRTRGEAIRTLRLV